MKLLKSDGIWIWEGGFNSRHIPKAAKFKWNPDGKFWWTNQPDSAILLIEYADGTIKSELEEIKKNLTTRLEASIATDADIDIPCPENLKYFGYQKAGIAYALKNKCVLFGDSMGLGKTIQSIGVLNCEPSIKRVLIVTPASLKYNWKKELEQWLVRPMSIDIISLDSTKKSNADIIIINYDILSSKKVSWIHDLKFDIIIADEAHYVKNEKAKRSIAYYKLAEKVDRKLMLTGTPILNRPVELYYIIKSLGFDMDYWTYVRRYCDAKKDKYGWNLKGASNLEELQVKLRQTIMIRREKSEVLRELPPKRRQIIELDPFKYQSYIDAEQEYLKRNKLTFFEELDDIEANEDYEARVEALKEKNVSHIAEIARLRHMTAMAKVPDVIDHLKAMLDEVDKVIVFAHHRDVIESIFDAFSGKAVKLWGEMDAKDKDISVTRFQTDPTIKLFVGSIRAAGLGFTLTASSNVVFVESDYTPATMTQAEDRSHRISQTESVLIQHIVVDGSIDCNLAKKLVYKQNIIDKVLDYSKIAGHQNKERQILNAALQKTQDEINEAKNAVDYELSHKAKLRASTIVNDNLHYTHEDRELILKKLRYLTTSKPGLRGEDKSVGYVMAALDTLNNKQAYKVEMMLKKYSKQLQDI